MQQPRPLEGRRKASGPARERGRGPPGDSGSPVCSSFQGNHLTARIQDPLPSPF